MSSKGLDVIRCKNRCCPGCSLVWCGPIHVVILYHPHHKCGSAFGVNMSTPLRSGHHFAPPSLPGRCQHQPLQIQPPSAPLLPLLFSLDLSYRTWCWRDSGNNSRTEPTEPGQQMPWGKDWWDWNPVQWRGAPLTTAELSLGQLSWAERRWQNGWQSGSDLQDQPSGAGGTAAQTPAQNWAQQSSGAAWLRGLICHWLSLFQAGRCGKC